MVLLRSARLHAAATTNCDHSTGTAEVAFGVKSTNFRIAPRHWRCRTRNRFWTYFTKSSRNALITCKFALTLTQPIRKSDSSIY